MSVTVLSACIRSFSSLFVEVCERRDLQTERQLNPQTHKRTLLELGSYRKTRSRAKYSQYIPRDGFSDIRRLRTKMLRRSLRSSICSVHYVQLPQFDHHSSLFIVHYCAVCQDEYCIHKITKQQAVLLKVFQLTAFTNSTKRQSSKYKTCRFNHSIIHKFSLTTKLSILL